ncbi:MAG TPA: DUF2721 domain-containing protein [Abditibacteriaceae bacterium]|jgi:hypothetical protein
MILQAIATVDPQINPFAALSLIAAPAVLTNSSSVLIMSTSNRLARATDRARALTAQLENAETLPNSRAPVLLQELAATSQRALMLLQALRCFYIALGSFATATLLSLIGAVLVPTGQSPMIRALEIIAIIVGVAAVISIVSGSVLLVRETRIAVDSLQQRTAILTQEMQARDRARNEASRGNPSTN